ncbi:MAG TPA: hypothetical protein VGV07_22170 [Devosia sp.]|jgi:hypothetical protein|uniref:hypothetical protein n=1 Tax=Devosia sp. TaxID=1871048 RepID=UPI002DDDB6BB|nr:hypothetical protein [Devosia sp.]HEV2517974.1 hypothetical protein [Devosia sp.]
MPGLSQPNREAEILRLWESAGTLDRRAREDALLAARDRVPARLGARNLGLLALRQALFDRPWSLRAGCPACGADCGFDIHAGSLLEALEPTEPVDALTLDWRGHEVQLRPPEVEDLEAIASIDDVREASLALIARCAGGAMDFSDASAAELEAIEAQLALLDPAALVSFELSCPECSAQWSAGLDIGDTLWREVQQAAEETLLSVDALARQYGWTESEILSLSPLRRAAYLQLGDAS